MTSRASSTKTSSHTMARIPEVLANCFWTQTPCLATSWHMQMQRMRAHS